MRIIVTGGAGFIGSAVVREIINNSRDEVLNLDCLTYAGNPANLNSISSDSRYQFAQVDIRDKQAVQASILEFEPDMILHGNLIDYSKMFINKELDFTSKAQKNWNKNKNEVFFKESLYSWKKHEGFDFSGISSKVADTLLKYGYK